MQILIVAPEANPFARSGALAEVIFSLSKALSQNGHRVSVVLPFYRQVKESGNQVHFCREKSFHPFVIQNADC